MNYYTYNPLDLNLYFFYYINISTFGDYLFLFSVSYQKCDTIVFGLINFMLCLCESSWHQAAILATTSTWVSLIEHSRAVTFHTRRFLTPMQTRFIDCCIDRDACVHRDKTVPREAGRNVPSDDTGNLILFYYSLSFSLFAAVCNRSKIRC